MSTATQPGFGVEVDLHAAVGKMSDTTNQLTKAISDLQENYASLSASSSTSASLVTVLRLHPQIPLGRVYDLRVLAIAPNPIVVSNVITPVACDIAVFVGVPSTGTIGATASQWRDGIIGGNIPVAATYARGEFPIRGGDHIFVILGKMASAPDVQVTAICGDNRDV